MVPILAGLVSGVLSAGSQVGTYLANQRLQEKERMYNSPVAQVKRLRAAGINPYAAVGQIAGNNQGSYGSAAFDFGSSFNSALSAASETQKLEMNDLYRQKLNQEIERLMLDNRFNGLSMDDRLQFLNYRQYNAYLDALYSKGRLTRQEYDNEVANINTQWAQYMSGQDTPLFGHPSVQYQDPEDPAVTHVLNVPPMLFDRNQQVQNNVTDTEFKLNTYEYKKEYEKFKTLKTEQDYKIACSNAVRYEIAANFERRTHMPFNNRNPWLHVVDKALDAIGRAMKDPGGFSWKNVWYYLDLD